MHALGNVYYQVFITTSLNLPAFCFTVWYHNHCWLYTYWILPRQCYRNHTEASNSYCWCRAGGTIVRLVQPWPYWFLRKKKKWLPFNSNLQVHSLPYIQDIVAANDQSMHDETWFRFLWASKVMTRGHKAFSVSIQHLDVRNGAGLIYQARL